MKTSCFVLICAMVTTLGSAAFAEGDNDTATLNQIASYRQWTRVNPEPVEVSIPVTRTAGTISIDAAVAS